MKVPDNYFEDFPARMNSLIDEENHAPTIDNKEKKDKVGIIVKLKPFIYMAAMYISLFLFFKAFIKDSNPPNELLSNIETISDEQALMEDAMYASLSDYDLMEYLYVNAN